MNIKLTNEVIKLQNLKDELSDLIRIIDLKNHKIIFERDLQDFPFWLDHKDKEILEQYLAASIIGDTPSAQCTVIKDASAIEREKIFSIDEAIKFINRPLTILVENSNNDSSLILLILDLYTSTTSSSYYNGNLDFGHAGGCGAVKAVIEEKLKQCLQRPKMLRYYVIVDGDKRYATHQVKKYEGLIEFLKRNNIGYHIFEKRCMENYMPTEAYPQKERNKRWLCAFSSLSPVQRDFLNIGSGLIGDLTDANKKNLKLDNSNLRELLCKEQQDFYADVSDANLIMLAQGYNIPSFKEEFPKGFRTGSISREMLDDVQKHQDNPKELNQLAFDIINLL